MQGNHISEDMSRASVLNDDRDESFYLSEISDARDNVEQQEV